MTADVLVGDDELGSGRFVVLHNPDGHDAWDGTFRVVTFARAGLDPEMAADPLVTEVGWSWLMECLEPTSGAPSLRQRHRHPGHVRELRRDVGPAAVRRDRGPGLLDPHRREDLGAPPRGLG